MLPALRRIWTYEMTIAEWIGAAVIVAVPYLLVGIIWALTHTGHLAGLSGAHRVLSFIAFVVCWPLLVLTNMCMA
jgi:hypothetical protein